MKKWLKEPLVHFLFLGALVFVLFGVVNTDENFAGGVKIVVTSGDIGRLSNNWERKWNRAPTETELQGLIESYIREEVFFREAVALGLDRDDTIIRRRMMQKLEFLTNDLSDINVPDEEALNKYFLDHRDKYMVPARVTFTHVYFNLDERGARARKDAANTLEKIRALREPAFIASERGDSFMIGNDFKEETPFEVERLFGKDFTDRLFTLETDAWQGPIESGYGLHLVRISEKIAARMPELSEVVDRVRTDWTFEQRRKTNEEVYKRFRERYEIVIEEIPKQSGMATTKLSDGGSS